MAKCVVRCQMARGETRSCTCASEAVHHRIVRMGVEDYLESVAREV